MFITLEGIEGSGKTSQIPAIVDYLTKTGHDCLTTREPGGTPIGGKIRSILLDPDNTDLASTTELLLYAADRVQHLETVILPALDTGKSVVCDRYFDATLAYQGYARGLDRELIDNLHQLACRGLKPDFTLLLDLPPETGLARAWHRIDANAQNVRESRFEAEALTFHQRVREGYLALAQSEPQRFAVIDADKDEKTVGSRIEEALSTFIERYKNKKC